MSDPRSDSSALGWFELCLNVSDVKASLAFYEALGFRGIGGIVEKGYVFVQRGDCRLALYQGHIENNQLNFRGGDIAAMVDQLKQHGITPRKDLFTDLDGSAAALFEDPDGNEIYFENAPGEVRAG